MKFTKQEEVILASHITEWSKNVALDYGIYGNYITSFHNVYADEFYIIFEESGKARYAIIECASSYDVEDIYKIWSSPECIWFHFKE